MSRVSILSEGLGHPEGPYVMPDGRVVLANTYRSEIAVWDAKAGTSTYAFTGGCPNACMLGTDGNVYVTNCPNVGKWEPDDKRPASIQRATPNGKVEIVATEADGVKFDGPNDLTFGPDGRLYFTDPADYLPNDRKPGRIFRLEPDGSGALIEEVPDAYPNGITAEADGAIVWVESYERGVYRKRGDAPSERIAVLPEGHIPDGLKVAADGDLWITTVLGGTVDILAPDGTFRDSLETGGAPLNCLFVDGDLIITDFGDRTEVPATAPMDGRLWRVDVGVAGMPLFRGSIG